MPTTEEELVMSVQHMLAQSSLQLQWVKTFQAAGIPTIAQGLLLRCTNSSEFKLVVLRTKRPRTYPVKHKRRTVKVTVPEE